ncbi:MAG: chemotaxis protein CheA [Bacteroidales bacterium]|nr:chemotaxis protein CheA [Bacteroidales bacterium]
MNEALQLIEKIEEVLFDVENRSATDDDIQEIYRVMHTLKGSAGMFSFQNTQKIGHQLEDIYQLILDKKYELNKDVIDVTIESIDLLNLLLNSNDQLDKTTRQAFKQVLDRIDVLLPGDLKNKDKSAGKDWEIMENHDTGVNQAGKKWFFIGFHPDEEILLKGVSPLGVFDELSEIGVITGFANTDKIPFIEEFDIAKFYLSWDLFVNTACSKEDIEDCFLFYEPTEFKILEFDLGSIHVNKELKHNCQYLSGNKITTEQLEEHLKHIESGEESDAPVLQTETDNKEEQPKNIKSEKDIQSVKVDAQKLDDLINLVSELVTVNSRMQLYANDIEHEGLTKAIKTVTKLSKRFRDNALDLRLIPIKVLVLKIQRLIRNVSQELGKEVEFITNGTSTELDKNIISKLDNLLVHLVRNSIDHGLETPEEREAANKNKKGVIRFIAFYSGSNVFIQIQDDGKGIDTEKVRQKALEKGFINDSDQLSDHDILELLFTPGFSTASSVSNISGRGVGLDVVKKEISEMRGEIDIESEKGLGTSFTLKLPLTLSIIDTLMVSVNYTKVLIPRDNIIYTELVKYSDKEMTNKMEYEDKVIPVISLPEEFHKQTTTNNEGCNIVVTQNERMYAFYVDSIVGEHQAVVKPLGYYTQNHDYFSGVSILGDGSLSFILDINKVINAKRNKTKIGNYNLQ